MAQEKGTITGTVTDLTSGEVLMGVNIIVVGSTSGFTTSLDGTYERINWLPELILFVPATSVMKQLKKG